jgi:hypothetical protein
VLSDEALVIPQIETAMIFEAYQGGDDGSRVTKYLKSTLFTCHTCPFANSVLPPSTAMLLPCTYALALLTRNNTMPAKSSNPPVLFAGTFSTKSPKISAPEPVPIGFMLLGTTVFIGFRVPKERDKTHIQD